jgi:hypothetical protein
LTPHEESLHRWLTPSPVNNAVGRTRPFVRTSREGRSLSGSMTLTPPGSRFP